MLTSTALTYPQLKVRIEMATIDSINTRRPRWVYNRKGEPFMYVNKQRYFDTDDREITETVKEVLNRGH